MKQSSLYYYEDSFRYPLSMLLCIDVHDIGCVGGGRNMLAEVFQEIVPLLSDYFHCFVSVLETEPRIAHKSGT